jgi:hypothetical protein
VAAPSRSPFKPFQCKVLLAISNILAHVWFVDVMQGILGSSCLIFDSSPRLLSSEDLSCFLLRHDAATRRSSPLRSGFSFQSWGPYSGRASRRSSCALRRSFIPVVICCTTRRSSTSSSIMTSAHRHQVIMEAPMAPTEAQTMRSTLAMTQGSGS